MRAQLLFAIVAKAFRRAAVSAMLLASITATLMRSSLSSPPIFRIGSKNH
jgi:hypothetical protein